MPKLTAVGAVALGVVGSFALLSLAARAAATVDMSGASHCSIRGYLNDPDPKGTNVHASPRAAAPIVGRLPPRAKLKGEDEIVGVEFEIIGAKDGWLLVRNSDRGDFKGLGWVSGRLVSFIIGSAKLLAAPAENAKVIASLQHTGETGIGPDSFEVRQVHGCQGHYADVTVALAASIEAPPGMSKMPMRGWVGKVCSNQLTTCDPY